MSVSFRLPRSRRFVHGLPLTTGALLVLTACGTGDVGGIPGIGSLASDGGFGGSGGATPTGGLGGMGGFVGTGGTSSSDATTGAGGSAPTVPTCDADAKTGDYCAGDKVSDGVLDTLYHCAGPGLATKPTPCENGCFVATGTDDFCELVLPSCAHKAQLKYGLAPAASDHLRCVGITADKISQTIGNYAASAGTHAQDGTIDGYAYSAATDLSVKTLTNAQVKVLVDNLATHGFAAFFRDPGKDGWPASEARHIHAIYVDVKMKASLRAQVKDWLAGLNGLASHTKYTFYQASPAQKQLIKTLFESKN